MLSKRLDRSLKSGTFATITSAVALALMARLEGKGPLQPINATSHWIYMRGPQIKRGSVKHTTVGLLTHHAASIFWAALFEASLAVRPIKRIGPLALRAAQVAGLAAAVDYVLTPKRFTPGWELALSKRSIGALYAAMAAGLAIGSLCARSKPWPGKSWRRR